MRKALYTASAVTPKDMITPYSGVSPNYNDYIPFGSDNLFPNALALFTRQSPNHRGVVDSKIEYCLGDGIVPVNENDSELEDMIARINFEGESLIDIQEKLYRDEFTTGNIYLEAITDKNQSFLFLNHIDATMCRLSRDKDKILIHPDWSQYTGKNDKHLKSLPLYPNFEPDSVKGISAYRCIFRAFKYEPEFTFYGIPKWIAGKDSVQIDIRTNKWNLARLKNSFRPGATLVVPVSGKAEAKKVNDMIKGHYSGEDNQGKPLLITKSRALENEKADQTQYIPHTTEDKGSWTELHTQSLSDVIVAHSWYRALTGIADNTGFDTQRILNEYDVALSTTITTIQSRYIKIYQKLYNDVTGQQVELTFQNSPPIKTDKYKFIWEARRDRGLPFDETDEKQKLIIM